VKHVASFVRQLIEDGALGARIVGESDPVPTPAAFDLHDIEAFCRFSPPRRAVSIRLKFFGYTVDPAAYTDSRGFYDFDRVARLHHGGATIVANEVDLYSGPVYRLKLELEALLRCKVGVNCYATPMKAQGFSRHVDGHDVIIVQLRGRKRWQLFDRAPYVAGDYTMDGFTQDRPAGETVLEPGDLLYLPAGFVHAAKSVAGATSVHLTLGFVPPATDALTGPKVRPPLTLPDDIAGLAAVEPDSAFASLERSSAGAGDLLTLRAPEGRVLELKPTCAAAWTEIERGGTFRPRDLEAVLPDGHATLFCYYLLNNGLLRLDRSSVAD
jgi:cupin superfamily protein